LLVLTRKEGGEIVLRCHPSDKETEIRIMAVEISRRHHRVRLGITADKSVSIHRAEVQSAIDAEAEMEPRPAL